MLSTIPNITYTLKHDLCTGCGICEGACPCGAISTIVKDNRFYPSIDDNKCRNNKGCHRCYDACPGLGINLFKRASQLYIEDEVKENKFIGRYINCYTGYSNNKDLRYHAASGGVVSQFLIWLLENDKIDGAVVTRFDKHSSLKVKTFIATTHEDILLAKGSKYAPVSLHNTVQDIMAAKGHRYVVVGIPCQIEGMRKLMAIDKRLCEKIVGLFAIYCSGTRTFNFTEYVMKERGINLNVLDYLAYRDNGCLGGMVAKGKGIDFYEDYLSYCHPLRTIFYPRRCLLCVDHFGELGDVCFGDIYVKPYSDDKVGVNSIVVRNRHWQTLLEEAGASNCMTLEKLDPEVLLSSQKMSRIKKSRNMGYCLLNKKMGRIVPDYGTTYGVRISFKYVINYIRMACERFVGYHKGLWFLIRFMKSKANKY